MQYQSGSIPMLFIIKSSFQIGRLSSLLLIQILFGGGISYHAFSLKFFTYIVVVQKPNQYNKTSCHLSV